MSDTSYRDPSTDESGPALERLLTSLQDGVYNVTRTEIVPDDPDRIRSAVQAWCDERLALVVTSGGTGFGVRDNTPEVRVIREVKRAQRSMLSRTLVSQAVGPLIDKPAPGLVTTMLSSSLAITPLAALSRPVAGIRLHSDGSGKGTLIVTLPGSPKGAKENLESLLKVLPHALDQANGGTGRAVHKMMGAPDRQPVAGTSVEPVQASTGCGHHHRHHGHGGGGGHAAPQARTQLSQDPSLAGKQVQEMHAMSRN